MSELLEKILSNDNMNAAYKRVCANKGAGGVDDVTVEELGDYIREQREYKVYFSVLVCHFLHIFLWLDDGKSLIKDAT